MASPRWLPGHNARVIAVGTAGVVAALALGALAPQPTAPLPPPSWTLDTTFSGDGVLTTSLPGGQSEADWGEGVVVQPDGRVVVAGTHDDYRLGAEDTGDLAVVPYRNDGSLDPTFGDGGIVRTSIGKYDDTGGVTLQRIGDQTKIVVVGHVYRSASPGPNHQDFVVRLNPDGSLDSDSDADPGVHLDHDGIATVPFRYGGSATP